MKTKFSNSSLVHEFSAQSQSFGKSGSMFFEDNVIYSYGHHFPIAKIIDTENVLFTYRTYSNTTAKHIRLTKSALSHYNMIYCYVPDGISHNQNIAEFYDMIKSLRIELSKVRGLKQISNIISSLKFYIANFKEYVSLFEYSVLPEISEHIQAIEKLILSPEFTEKQKQWFKRYSIEKRENAKIEKELKAKQLFENIEKFNNFEINHVWDIEYQLLRYNAETNNFETSKQVKIPFDVAKCFYVSLKRNSLQVGQHILNFKVNYFDENIIKIGCHTFGTNYLLEYGKKYF